MITVTIRTNDQEYVSNHRGDVRVSFEREQAIDKAVHKIYVKSVKCLAVREEVPFRNRYSICKWNAGAGAYDILDVVEVTCE